MERTDEVIYQRAAEEHIRRPPLWHDDEVDSVRVRLFCFDFSYPRSGNFITDLLVMSPLIWVIC